MAKQQPETAIRRSVRDYLRLMGWFVFYIQQGMGSYPGIADLYCLRDGREVWVEIKTPKGTQSDQQKVFESDIRAHGGEYVVCRGVEDAIAMSGDAVLL